MLDVWRSIHSVHTGYPHGGIGGRLEFSGLWGNLELSIHKMWIECGKRDVESVDSRFVLTLFLKNAVGCLYGRKIKSNRGYDFIWYG